MYQHQKIKTGQEGSLSKYCPIDLFSGTELMVQDALDSLVDTPQNNLRLFMDGIQHPVSRESMTQCLSEISTSTSSQTQEQQQKRKPQCIEGDDPLDYEEDDSWPVRLTEVLTQILIESPLLKRLGRLQQALDSLDVETVHRLYTYLIEHDSAPLPEPSVEEFLKTAEAFMDRTDMDAMMAEDQEAFETHNAAGLGFEPEDDLEDLPESLKLHFIREFLLSATLKDCSILVTIQRDASAAVGVTTANTTSSRYLVQCVKAAVRTNGRTKVLMIIIFFFPSILA
jgi:hypothetical protein